MNEFVTEEQVALAYKFILNRDPDAEGMKAFCGRVGLNDLCAHL